MSKRLSFFGLLILLTTVWVSSSAIADTKDGWYVSGGAGVAVVSDLDWNTATSSGDSELDAGYVVQAAVGYKFGMPRVEAEVSYQKNDYDKYKIGGTTTSAGGDVSALNLMVNGYVDIANESSFTPFVFCGLGISNVEAELTNGGTTIFNDDDTVFAYQVGVGVGMDVAPQFMIDLRYAYFGTSDPDLTDPTGATQYETEFSSHNVTLGLRYSF